MHKHTAGQEDFELYNGSMPHAEVPHSTHVKHCLGVLLLGMAAGPRQAGQRSTDPNRLAGVSCLPSCAPLCALSGLRRERHNFRSLLEEECRT